MPPERTHTTQQAAAQPSMTASLASLDAKIRLIAQQLKILENNEQVISRTLVGYGKKIKDLETAQAAGASALDLGKLKESLKEELKAGLAAGSSGELGPPLEEASPRTSAQLTDLRAQLDELAKEVKELRYIVDSINPLEYVTLDQLNEAIDRKNQKKGL